MSRTEELKGAGLKATGPRLTILNLFENNPGGHYSADDVYRLLVQAGEDVGIATVYRVLTQFEQAGILTRHHFEGGRAVYELSPQRHHDHLVCVRCGKVEEFYDPEIEARQEAIARERGYILQDHALYLYVECQNPECPNRQK